MARGETESEQLDPILALRGLGKEIWEGEDPDAYVRRLREGWDGNARRLSRPGPLRPPEDTAT